ncbi:MAG: DMT family transporter [Bacteroidota bacterium]
MTDSQKGLLWVHLATLLFGFPGLFAEWLDFLPSEQIVAGRTLFGSLFLLILLSTIGKLPVPKDKRIWGRLVLTGVILAFHWWAFFRAIQLTNVAIGLLTFSTFPLFTSVLEPIFLKEKLKALDVGLALLVILGVAIVGMDALSLAGGIEGFLWGIAGGASFAVMAIVNRGLGTEIQGLALAAWQNLFAFLCLLPLVIQLPLPTESSSWGLLALLGILFTGIAHGLFNESMRFIRASTASLIVSMEPFYGIILAYMLLGQEPKAWTLLGGSLILLAGFVPTWLGLRRK